MFLSKKSYPEIKFFDYEAFSECNQDIAEMIAGKKYESIKDYLKKTGITEIEKGVRRFHRDFQHFDESVYLEAFPDVKAAVDHKEFASGFVHFSLFGYREILEHKRIWPAYNEKSPRKIKSVVAVVGLPRSGLTLLEALLGSHSGIAPWFLPYSTRKDQGIKPFSDSESIQTHYGEAFSGEKIKSETVVISESTSDEKNIEFIAESLENLSKNGIQTKIIWIVRDVNLTYLSQIEAAMKYWDADNMDATIETYSRYIDFAKKGYGQIIDLVRHREHRLVSYQSLTSETSSVIKEIHNFIKVLPEDFLLYDQDINSSRIAGDPGFLDHSSILKKRDAERQAVWEKYNELVKELDEHSSLFVGEFNALIKDVNNSTISAIDDYAAILTSRYFDKDYYLEHYDDIKKADIDPLEHYLEIGWKENRNPNAPFDTKWYRENIFDDGGTNPWIDYLLKGRFSGVLKKSIDENNLSILEDLVLIDPETYMMTDDLLLEAPKFDNPKVSIIIPVFNQQNYTLACIESIIRNTEQVSYEIIIMDDCSSDPEAREIGKYMKNILFHSNDENLGFLRNCNKGAQFAKGTYLMLLNNDTNVQSGWLSSLIELIESSDTIGMVGSKLVYPTGQLQDAGGIVWSDASGWNFGRLDNPYKPEYNYVKETDYLTGATMMIRKTLWDEIGGFDELYVPAYYEDPDFAFEVRKAGYKVLYQPKSIVIHFEGITNGTDLGSGVKRYQVINREKFYEKWKEELDENQFSSSQDVFLARDRSARKKHMLFVDHYLPHYDQDAGSKAALDYLKIFVKNDIQVHFIGDNFYDYPGTPYLETLTQMGIEVLCGEWYARHWQEWFRENGEYFDYVLLSRPHIAEKYIDIVKEASSAKIIYFGHDLHFLRERREYEVKKDDAYLQSSFEWLKRELDLSAKADVSYFFSDVEKKEMQKINPFASIDVVPLYIYDTFRQRKRKSKKRKDIMFVGGFAHTPNSDAMIWFVEKIWPYIEKKIPEVKFYIIGSKPTEEIMGLAKENIIVTGYVDDATLDDYYKHCKVVVAPLRYGAGVKGKVVDALYNGMPLVTTSIGAEGFMDAASTMLIEDKPKKFAKRVVSIYLNDDLADSYAAKAVKYCELYFSEDYAEASMPEIFDNARLRNLD